MDKSLIRIGVIRLLVILALSCVAVLGFSELAFRMQPHNIDRDAQEIELTIPPGTAELVAAGESVPAIPPELVFVLGDVLIVHNMDSVTHELGPLLVPAGTSARLPMDRAENFALTCSFTTSNYLGLDVKEPTTWRTRMVGVAFAAPATTVMAFLYSLIVWPIQAKPKIATEEAAA